MADKKSNMNDNSKYTEGLLDALKDDIRYNISAGVELPLTDYLDKMLNIMKRRYESMNKWGRFHTWSRESLQEVVHIWEEAKPELIKKLEDYIKQCKSRKMTKDIKIVSSRILIKTTMEEAGLQYRFEGQTYRAKVTVRISDTRALIVYIPYSKINENLPRTMEAIKLIREQFEILGKNTTLAKVSRYDNWD